MDAACNYLADHPWLTCAVLISLIGVAFWLNGVLP